MKTTIKQIPHTETWDMRHRIMWSHMPFDFVKLPNDAEGVHFGLYTDDKLTTIVSLFIEKGTAQFRKLATEPHEQGKGYGTLLLSHLFDYAKQQGIRHIWCNARANKSRFYEKFGMVETDKKYVKGGIEFVVMEKEI